MPQSSLQDAKIPTTKITLVDVKESDFHQISAIFQVKSDKTTAFKVISNLSKTKEWLPEVASIQTVEVYDFNNFLLRTVLDSPWPFKQRETITCVSTTFDEKTTRIDIKSCPQRYPANESYVRVEQLKSSWRIRQLANDTVEIDYQVWLDPKGYVPAYFFNQQLLTRTKNSLNKLQIIINDTSPK
ncbi:START domain-containing protein [Psychrobium sp. nBUS_13]|uniref:START domain-containing protein n=1 Tax=Psychrobium sp. nBUS_13 TaxID=3395319 RepID=UPI003EBE0B09